MYCSKLSENVFLINSISHRTVLDTSDRVCVLIVFKINLDNLEMILSLSLSLSITHQIL